jgi:hypothetical protein
MCRRLRSRCIDPIPSLHVGSAILRFNWEDIAAWAAEEKFGK